VWPRLRFGQRQIDYRHYVRELAKKPQAVRQVAPELVGDLGEPFGAAWRHLVDIHGPKEASRVFAHVLAHVERDGITLVADAVGKALARGEPILLALAAPTRQSATLVESDVPTHLRSLEIACGRAADYDQWLQGGER
jgi:hypothetical protein